MAPLWTTVHKLVILDIFGLVSNPGKENLSFLRLNLWCVWRRDPQSLTSRWKTTRCSFFMMRCAGQPGAARCPFARTARNTDWFHFGFWFARRLFSSSSSSLAADFLLAVLWTAAAPSNKPSSRGVCRNWGSEPLLSRSFCLCQFWPRANFALRWVPTSRAKLRESESDYTQFDWWAPVASPFTRGAEEQNTSNLFLPLYLRRILIIFMICTLVFTLASHLFFPPQIHAHCPAYIEKSVLLLCLKVTDNVESTWLIMTAVALSGAIWTLLLCSWISNRIIF